MVVLFESLIIVVLLINIHCWQHICTFCTLFILLDWYCFPPLGGWLAQAHLDYSYLSIIIITLTTAIFSILIQGIPIIAGTVITTISVTTKVLTSTNAPSTLIDICNVKCSYLLTSCIFEVSEAMQFLD